MTLDSYEGQVALDLGTHLVAGRKPFELRVTRKSYGDPIVVTQIVNGRPRTLPAGLVKDFSGLPGFLHVKLTNAAGRTVLERDQAICPNFEGVRSHPDAPDNSPYPEGCPGNPFTLGSVWGIQAGWANATVDPNGAPVKLANGKYTAQISVPKKYRDLFGIPANQSAVTVKVTVRPGPDHDHRTRMATKAALQPNATRPKGPNLVPPVGPKPDLRSLPAWEVNVSREGRKDFLQFSANVWNAGPSPLVVDGFRRTGQDIMDAYQYFYNARGQQVGHAKTGTMEWDPKEGHHHWHFRDFAMYQLLKSNQTTAVRSQKEAFCLANTDAVDYTVKNAKWKPTNTDLHTACGSQGSLAVREVLDVGSGDTYVQSVAGQSFDITNLPNGTYYIQVVANPTKRLYESNTKNNVSLRKVVLGGRPGARTVKVPPHQLINAP